MPRCRKAHRDIAVPSSAVARNEQSEDAPASPSPLLVRIDYYLREARPGYRFFEERCEHLPALHVSNSERCGLMKPALLAMVLCLTGLTIAAMVSRAVMPLQVLWVFAVWVEIPFIVWLGISLYSARRRGIR